MPSVVASPTPVAVPSKVAVTFKAPASLPLPDNDIRQTLTPPPSYFKPLCHPNVDAVAKEVDGYFLKHWNFTSARDKKKFVNAGFSRVTCLYFPEALDDRIHFACRLLTVLFLVDDLLEDMSFDEGSAYNEHLIPISRGDVLPNRSIPVEYILYDLWESMRAHDRELADEILEPVFLFMRAQTDKTRVGMKTLGNYLLYRERDVGKALLTALMRFSMGLHMTEKELDYCREVDLNCSRHISVVNDIWSWEKELLAAKTGHVEGSALCSSVQVIADECQISILASKRVLYAMCREWELCHNEIVARKLLDVSVESRETLKRFTKGLEYQMSGNELWSRTTLRYIGIEV
ncbi:Aristolochene synthase in complex with 12,13 Difluorofarnesyl diphosphate [Amniculicola lignicola CBS 123094]|uniref:Terpene synthase n=1 Tax=Amniculicola lignicola CBS 123094 TaxID=1392246 RepID=A0A6A5VWK6_9PLEO|nr:Aristolochene synthase in complex with 12,13 Difluorofarnesyl diphosphate [Amniculicola lignicola CBS 123094]